MAYANAIYNEMAAFHSQAKLKTREVPDTIGFRGLIKPYLTDIPDNAYASIDFLCIDYSGLSSMMISYLSLHFFKF